MVEIWKTVPYAPLYQVSNLGNVRSLTRTFQRNGHKVTWPGRTINPWKCWHNGRPLRAKVSLRADGRTIQKFLHHLVLETFVGPRPEGLQGCHNDGNPFNNALSNLRWDSMQANIDDMAFHGTRKNPPTHWGESHHNATISDADVAYIRSLPYRRGLYATLGRQFNVAQITIRRIHKYESRVLQNELDRNSKALCWGKGNPRPEV